MSTKTVIPARDSEEVYREETVRIPVMLTLLLVTLVAAPASPARRWRRVR